MLSLCLLSTALILAPAPEASAELCKPYRIPGAKRSSGLKSLSLSPSTPSFLKISTRRLMRSSVQTALASWADLECVTMELDFVDDDEGFSSCPGEVIDDRLQCLYWVQSSESWTFGSGLIAVTLVHHNALTGEIVDTDMALNGTGTFTWSAPSECDMDTPDHDLLATLTHEFGHFFGLDHSSAPQSVMEAATGPGDCDKRTLADFDAECFARPLRLRGQRWRRS